jgi:hypothetical protein
LLCLLSFLPSAPQASPQWVLRRRPRKFGGRRRAERESESTAPQLQGQCRAECRGPPPKAAGCRERFCGGMQRFWAAGQRFFWLLCSEAARLVLKLRAGSDCSAFCLLRRRPVQSGCCAAGRENLVADDELSEREREQSPNPELRRRPSPRSACSAFCLLRRRPVQNGCCAAGLEILVAGGRRARATRS